MPSLIDLRRRIRSVKNTQQITKAMKMVAAAKLRRAQERIMNARPYAVQMQRVLGSVDRKSTRLNSSHLVISYAVFCLKKKNTRSVRLPRDSLAPAGALDGEPGPATADRRRLLRVPAVRCVGPLVIHSRTARTRATSGM